MANIYSFRKPMEVQESQLLAMFNHAVNFIFRPRARRDPALVFCELLAKTIVKTGENPHLLLYGEGARPDRIVVTG